VTVPFPLQTHIEQPDLNTKEGIRSYIALEAQKRGVEPSDLLNTISGESEYRMYVPGDNGVACGLTQYHEDTFNRHKKKAISQGEPFERLTYCDPRSEIQLMAWAFSQGERYRNEWSAYRNLK